MELEQAVSRQLKIGVATTAGAMLGAALAKQTGWNQTLTIAASSIVGLAVGVSLKWID